MFTANPARELLINQRIQEQINTIDPTADTLISYDNAQGRTFWELINRTIEYSPDILFMAPIGGSYFMHYVTMLKYSLDFLLICYATEGGFTISSETCMEMLTGMGEYSRDLVDARIFWGNLIALATGEAMIKQNKLHSKNQVFTTGYPLYEDFFNNVTEYPSQGPSEEDTETISKFDGHPIFLFASGFNVAGLSREAIAQNGDLFSRTDPLREKKIDILVKEFGLLKIFREKLVSKLIECAKANKDSLFIYKLHPWEVHGEKAGSFSELEGYENIIVIDYQMQISSIIKKCSVFFHIGSTSAAESYIAKTPSCLLTCAEIEEFVKSEETYFLGVPVFFPSHSTCEVMALDEAIRNFKLGGITFKRISEADEKLLDYFNIDIENSTEYRPSYDTAKIILSDIAKHRIMPDDPFLKEAVNSEVRDIFFDLILNYAISRFPAENHLRTLSKLAPYFEDSTLGSIVEEISASSQSLEKFLLAVKKYLYYSMLPVLYTEKRSIKAYIFGAGDGGRRMLERLSLLDTEKNINVLGYLDNSKEKAGHTFESLTVSLPDMDKINDCDYVIIASEWENEITEQLLGMNVAPSKLTSISLRRYIYWVYDALLAKILD